MSLAHCPLGDPVVSKHVWHLERTQNHYEFHKEKLTRRQWFYVALLSIIPVFGWIILVAWMTERIDERQVLTGEDEYWYCMRCRLWDKRFVAKENLIDA